MTRRAIPALIVVLLGVIGLVVVSRDTPEPEVPFFAAAEATWMPAVGTSGSLTGSWFCPGVETGDEAGSGGVVVVSNGNESEIVGRYQVLSEDGVEANEAFSVAPWSQTTIDVGELSDAAFSSVVVEIEGGRGFVEQVARNSLGDSAGACSNDTSANWYFADGYTQNDSIETLVLSNPFDEAVVADLRFSTEERQSEPDMFRGFTVSPRSVRTIQVDELGARDESIVSIAIEATSGRLFAGRVQEYQGGGRFGYDVSLGAPELRDNWWFVDGEVAEGVSETYSIYNPTTDEVEITVFFGGLPLSASAVNDGEPVIVPPLRSVIFDPSELTGSEDDEAEEPTETPDTTVSDASDEDDSFVDFVEPAAELPEGRHATVFSTLAQPSIVVERVITRQVEGSIATTVLLGAPPRPDGFVATSWRMGVGPESATQDALLVYNIDQTDAIVSVSAVTSNGVEVVPSLSEVELPAGEIITIDLVDDAALGRELIVTSTSRVFVERSLPRNDDFPGRSGSWLLPVAG